MLSPFFGIACTLWDWINIKEMFIFVMMNMTVETLTSYINLPITVDLCIGHLFTSPQDYGTIYLIVLVEPHLLTF